MHKILLTPSALGAGLPDGRAAGRKGARSGGLHPASLESHFEQQCTKWGLLLR